MLKKNTRVELKKMKNFNFSKKMRGKKCRLLSQVFFLLNSICVLFITKVTIRAHSLLLSLNCLSYRHLLRDTGFSRNQFRIAQNTRHKLACTCWKQSLLIFLGTYYFDVDTSLLLSLSYKNNNNSTSIMSSCSAILMLLEFAE